MPVVFEWAREEEEADLIGLVRLWSRTLPTDSSPHPLSLLGLGRAGNSLLTHCHKTDAGAQHEFD